MTRRIRNKLTTERGLLELFFSLRGLMLIASFGAILGALLMFWSGGIHLLHAYETLIHVSFGPENAAVQSAATPGGKSGGGDEAQVVVYVLEAVDAFLFALVLMIFAYGIALGFVFHHVPERYRDFLPSWMLVEGVGQLKRTLAEVVIVVLIVIFARIVIESRGNLSWTMLVLPASILLLSLALKMLHHADEIAPADNSPAPVKLFREVAERDAAVEQPSAGHELTSNSTQPAQKRRPTRKS
jgi:uncharacterized membrane protein YqhA